MPQTPSISLLIDASTPALQIGVYQQNATEWLAFERTMEEPLSALAPLAEQCIKASNLTLSQISKLIFCEGPGSLLGIRLCAMTLRIWKSLPQCHHLTTHSYRNLTLAARLLPPHKNALIITEAGRNRWATLATQDPDDTIQYLDKDALMQTTGPCHHIPQNKQWEAPPIPVITLDYTLSSPQALTAIQGLICPCPAPDALAPPASKQYATWSGERHRHSKPTP